MRPGDTHKIDSEYVRNTTCSIFVFVEPLGGVRHVSVRKHRTAVDWAEEIRYLADGRIAKKSEILLRQDLAAWENNGSHLIFSPPLAAKSI